MVFFPRYLLARLLALCVVLHVAVAIPVVHTSAGTLERRKPTQAILDEYQMLQIRILYFRLDEDEKKSDSVNPDLLGQYDKMWLCIGHNCFRGEKSRSSRLLPQGAGSGVFRDVLPQEKIATEKELGPALQIGVVSFLSLNQKDEILKSFGTKVIKEKKNNLSYIQGMIADLRASWRKGMTLGLDKRPPYTTHASQ